MRMIEGMKSDIAKLQDNVEKKDSEISLLKSKISGFETVLQSMESPTVFDCYLLERWDTNGIIQFYGCDGKHEMRQV